MPLKLIPPRAGKTKFWSVRGTYLGQHVDRSTKASKRAIAAKKLSQWEGEIERGEFAVADEPTFADAGLAYMNAGGEARFMTPLLRHFGTKLLRNIGQAEIDGAATALLPNASAATRNRQVYTPMSAVLKRAGIKIDLKRPIGAQGNSAVTWLWPEEAEKLFVEATKLNAEFGALLVLLCYTGLRLSEALNLTTDNVRLADGFAYIPTTKNEEPRAVFLPPVAVAALANCASRLDRPSARVFGFAKSGHLYSLLRTSAWKAGINLPERTAFHVLRHTYGTWMRRYGGLDTRGLVGTGAWKDEKSAARYAHTIVSEEAMKAALLPTPKIGRG